MVKLTAVDFCPGSENWSVFWNNDLSMLIKLFIAFISIFTSLTVYSANRCQSLFDEKAKSSAVAPKISTTPLPQVGPAAVIHHETLKTMHWKDRIEANNRVDAYKNTWSLHPEDSYIKVKLASESVNGQPKENYFRSVLYTIQRELYTRGEKNSKKHAEIMKDNAFLKSILLKSEDGMTATYTDIDFYSAGHKVSFHDFNAKSRLGERVGYDEWNHLVGYMEFLSKIYKSKLGLHDENMSKLMEITMDFMDRTTVAYKDTISEDQRRSTEMGILTVESRSVKESLPAEILHDINIREYMKVPENTGLAELGRFGKNEEYVDNSTDMIKMMVSSISARPNIKYVVIEVDQVRRRLWKPLGFEDIPMPEHLKKGEYYKSGTDFLMFVPVDVLVSKLFNDQK